MSKNFFAQSDTPGTESPRPSLPWLLAFGAPSRRRGAGYQPNEECEDCPGMQSMSCRDGHVHSCVRRT